MKLTYISISICRNGHWLFWRLIFYLNFLFRQIRLFLLLNFLLWFLSSRFTICCRFILSSFLLCTILLSFIFLNIWFFGRSLRFFYARLWFLICVGSLFNFWSLLRCGSWFCFLLSLIALLLF